METTVWALDIALNTRVIFSAFRSLTNVNTNEVITYTDVPINVGQGMDGSRGTFQVPVSGFYAFSFSAQAADHDPYTDIVVFKNDEYQFRISDHNKNEEVNMPNIGHSWYMQLDQNDRVYLQVTANDLFCSVSSLTWFNGHLLMAL